MPILCVWHTTALPSVLVACVLVAFHLRLASSNQSLYVASNPFLAILVQILSIHEGAWPGCSLAVGVVQPNCPNDN
jgi:hypothetical protein